MKRRTFFTRFLGALTAVALAPRLLAEMEPPPVGYAEERWLKLDLVAPPRYHWEKDKFVHVPRYNWVGDPVFGIGYGVLNPEYERADFEHVTYKKEGTQEVRYFVRCRFSGDEVECANELTLDLKPASRN